jgi:hypothetical protein
MRSCGVAMIVMSGVIPLARITNIGAKISVVVVSSSCALERVMYKSSVLQSEYKPGCKPARHRFYQLQLTFMTGQLAYSIANMKWKVIERCNFKIWGTCSLQKGGANGWTCQWEHQVPANFSGTLPHRAGSILSSFPFPTNPTNLFPQPLLFAGTWYSTTLHESVPMRIFLT